MTRKILQRSRKVLTDTNANVKTLAKHVNKLDKQLGFLGNSAVQQVLPYVNAAAYAIDAFDSLMPSFGVSTPQLTNGVSAGVSQTMQIRRKAPKITGSKGSVRITHKELIGDVTMVSTLATSQTGSNGTSFYYLSPTNSNLFPWLSDIAGNYDYFRFNRVRIVYVPLCATSTTGRVMLAYDPDGTDGIPYNRSSLSSYKCSVDSSAWGVSSLDCDLANNQPWFQTNAVSNTAAYSTSTQGQVFWSTWAGAGTSTVGEWYVLYDVTLKDPQPNTMDLWRSVGSAGSATTNFSLDSAAYYLTSDATTIRVGFAAAGSYLIQFFAASTALTATVGFNSSGAITIVPSGNKTGDGAQVSASCIVVVTGTGYSTSANNVVAPAYAQLGSLTALGAWTVLVSKVPSPSSYP